MELSRIGRLGLTTAVIFALAGCGGAGTTVPQGATAQSRAHQVGKSWMLPGSASGDLLYVAGRKGAVYVISYPQGELVGEVSLPAALNSGDLCSDGNGDIFVPDEDKIEEYAHGGTQPIAALDDEYVANACSVDATTGNLAVTNSESGSGGQGNVAIYPDAQGAPTYYSDSNIYNPEFCGYDNQGNLFVDADGPFAELPSGSRNFTNITLNKTNIAYGQIQWDGKHITVTSQNANKIYRLSISGSTGKVVSTTHLKGPGREATSQSWIQGSTIVAPIGPGQDDNRVGFWDYPRGGSAFTILNLGHHAQVIGATVSVAPSGPRIHK
jgi:hypothetical protein